MKEKKKVVKKEKKTLKRTRGRKVERIKTGIDGLDKLTEGGFESNSINFRFFNFL